jgi:cell division protein FtsA
LSHELGVDFEAAEKLKLSLSSDDLPEKRRTTVEGALDKTLDVWMSGVELALSEFDKLEHLPRKILLCGGGSSLEMLVEALQEQNWYRELPFTRKPIIQHIKPSQVVGIVDKTGVIKDHLVITAMGLLRVGVDTVGEMTSEHTTIKQRLNRLLSI